MAASVEYNPGVLQKFAQRLYARANSIVALYALAGAILGAGLGGVGGSSLDIAQLGIILGAVFFGLVGFSIGSERALALRVQAQTMLCQMSIEKHLLSMTRTQGSGHPAAQLASPGDALMAPSAATGLESLDTGGGQ